MTTTYFTLKEVREHLKLSPSVFKRLRAAGKFPRPAFDLGKKVQRWTSDQIDTWVAEQGQQGDAA